MMVCRPANMHDICIPHLNLGTDFPSLLAISSVRRHLDLRDSTAIERSADRFGEESKWSFYRYDLSFSVS